MLDILNKTLSGRIRLGFQRPHPEDALIPVSKRIILEKVRFL